MTGPRVIATRLGAGMLFLAVIVAASGWLYLLRPMASGWIGPRVPDAVPLDELPGHAAVPLVVFLAVWAVAGVLLGGIARLAGLGRLGAALILALGVGLCVYGIETLSLFIVQGTAYRETLIGAARLQAVYLPAAFAGAAGAMFAQSRARVRALTPVLMAVAVAVGGLVNIVSAVTPELRERLVRLEGIVPSGISLLASAVLGAVGVVLLLIARGLARRKRRAWQLAVALLAGSSLLHLLKGLHYEEAIVTGLLALILVARRHDFDAPGDPTSHSKVAIRVAAFAAAIYLYGAVALLVNSAQADEPYSVRFALLETTRALLGRTVRGSAHVAGRFGEWWPLSVFLLAIVAAASAVTAWLAPWGYRMRQEAQHRERARSIFDQWGEDTLAPFTLRGDKSFFFDPAERSFLAYRVVAGVALVSGDPIGPTEALPGLLAEFVCFCRERGWRVAILGASGCRLDLYRAAGLHDLYWGDEAVIDTAAFSLIGREIRKVRQSLSRLQRAGYTAETLFADQIGFRLRRELEAVSRAWRGDRPQRGFVMQFDTLFRLSGRDEVFVVGRDPEGTLRGFLHFAVSRPGSALSLSSMPRMHTTPNGFNEWLICGAVSWARDHGLKRVSLNFAPFASLLDPDAHLSGVQRLQRDALLALKSRLQLQLDNLLQFTERFRPTWQPRYVVYERRSDLPRVGLAALTAEGDLPFRKRNVG